MGIKNLSGTDSSSTFDDPQQYNHNGNHQKNMDKATHGVSGDQSQQPQDKHDDSNGIEHDIVLCNGLEQKTPPSTKAMREFTGEHQIIRRFDCR